MFKRSDPPKQLIKLSSRPLLSDLQKFSQQALRARELSIHLCWNSIDGMCGYTLTITSLPGSTDPQWRMISQTGAVRKDLWFYVTTDIEKVFGMFINSIGEDVAEAYAADTRTQAVSGIQSQGATASTAPPGADPAGLQRMAQASVANPNELLSGNLALLHITNLLQSISMGHMTGRLHIEPQAGPLDIFFEAGLPVHAVSRQSSGEETFLEVVALNNGIFAFEPSLRTDVRSINSPIDSLILKGIQVLDCLGMLEAAGVTADSIVHRAKQGLSEAGFEECIKQGAPLDLALQKRFYITIDGQKSVKQLADTLNLARSEWIPVVANLIKLKLASFTKGGQVAKRVITVPPKRIDLVVVEQFAHNIKRPDTGAFTYPCFHYFLNQEYQRYKRTESPVAVILLDLKLQKTSSGTARGVVTPQCLAFVVQCIQPLKRELDLIMHYEGQTLAVLLPHTHAQEAINLARRISTAVVEGKFLVGMEKLNVSAVLGVASIPGDVTTAGELLAAAEMAKEKAHMSADGIQLFSDLS